MCTPQYFYLRKWLSLQVHFPDVLRANFALPGHFFPHNEVCKRFFLLVLELLPPTNTYNTQCSELSYSVALLNALSWVIEDLGLLEVTSSWCRV